MSISEENNKNPAPSLSSQTVSNGPFRAFYAFPPRLILMGYMGAGKSTIGKMLARKINYRFMDTDRLLNRQFKKSMSRIFAEEGEQVFRQAELDLLKELVTKERVVISTGGGTLNRDETFALASENGFLIYLRADPRILYERVIFSPKDRPMIDVPDAEKAFYERFAEREKYYNRAHMVISTEGIRPYQVMESIVAGLLERFPVKEEGQE